MDAKNLPVLTILRISLRLQLASIHSNIVWSSIRDNSWPCAWVKVIFQNIVIHILDGGGSEVVRAWHGYAVLVLQRCFVALLTCDWCIVHKCIRWVLLLVVKLVLVYCVAGSGIIFGAGLTHCRFLRLKYFLSVVSRMLAVQLLRALRIEVGLLLETQGIVWVGRRSSFLLGHSFLVYVRVLLVLGVHCLRLAVACRSGWLLVALKMGGLLGSETIKSNRVCTIIDDTKGCVVVFCSIWVVIVIVRRGTLVREQRLHHILGYNMVVCRWGYKGSHWRVFNVLLDLILK